MTKKGEHGGQKSGPFSREDISFMREVAGSRSVEEIAETLRRNPKSVEKWIANNVPKEAPPKSATKKEKKEAEKSAIRVGLRSSLTWKQLKNELYPDELAYFEEEYAELAGQFQNDLHKTEENQIIKLIKFDIMNRRILVKRKAASEELTSVEGLLSDATQEYQRIKDKLDATQAELRRQSLLSMQTQLNGMRASDQAASKEYNENESRHQRLMEALKATREQRITRVESAGKQSMLSILRDLADEEKRDEAEKHMEMMRHATDKAFQRLAKPHKYADGQEDLPILSAETVELADAAAAANAASEEEDEVDDTDAS